MALTDDLARIDRALALGVLSVRVEGKEVTFPSADDLLQRRQVLADRILSEAGTPRRRYHRTYYTKGLR